MGKTFLNQNTYLNKIKWKYHSIEIIMQAKMKSMVSLDGRLNLIIWIHSWMIMWLLNLDGVEKLLKLDFVNHSKTLKKQMVLLKSLLLVMLAIILKKNLKESKISQNQTWLKQKGVLLLQVEKLQILVVYHSVSNGILELI